MAIENRATIADSPQFLPEDTIAAIATAPGEAGIAIVRVSGADSLAIADAVFRSNGSAPSSWEGGTFRRGFICTPTGAEVDEVLLLVYRQPHSYTREDVIEIQGHGGRVAVRRILETVLKAGARPAEPGEFTRRAFLNGRIDLVQAEAVADLIRSKTDRAAQAALEQLQGLLSERFNKVYDTLVTVAGDLEATLDFPEEDIPADALPQAMAGLGEARAACRELLATWQEGHLLREGATVVICGRPNAGKSTLLNCLLGKDRAIVNDTPGTTRDAIEEEMVLDGIPIRLIDTAGIRDSDCPIEREAVRRSRLAIERADLILYVVDLSDSQPDELNPLPEKPVIVIGNKFDIRNILITNHLCIDINTCLLSNEGLDALREAIRTKLGHGFWRPPHAAISEKQRFSLEKVERAIAESSHLLSSGNPEAIALAAGVVRDAAEEIAILTGRVFSADLLNSIFRRFCIGK